MHSTVTTGVTTGVTVLPEVDLTKIALSMSLLKVFIDSLTGKPHFQPAMVGTIGYPIRREIQALAACHLHSCVLVKDAKP